MSWDDTDYDESDFCPCGVTLMGDPGEVEGLCTACAAQPHSGRDSNGEPECRCDECEAYWDRLATRVDVTPDPPPTDNA